MADTKWRVNIPTGLCKFIPSESPIASVGRNPSEIALELAFCCAGSLTFIVSCISSAAGRRQWGEHSLCIRLVLNCKEGSLLEQKSGQPVPLSGGRDALTISGDVIGPKSN